MTNQLPPGYYAFGDIAVGRVEKCVVLRSPQVGAKYVGSFTSVVGYSCRELSYDIAHAHWFPAQRISRNQYLAIVTLFMSSSYK